VDAGTEPATIEGHELASRVATHSSMRDAPAAATQPDGASIDPGSVARRSAVAFVVLVVGMLVIGGLGDLLVFAGSIGDAEADAIGWIADHRVDAGDTVATVGSSLSDTWTVIGVLFGAVMMLLATGRRRCASLLVIGVSLEFVTFLVVGTVIDRPRPQVEALHSVPSTSSFPSGHVAVAVVLYGSLTLVARTLVPGHRVPRSTWLLPACVALVVGCSRVYEGVHHPTDVVAGALLGLGALVAAAYASGMLADRRPTVPDDD
jgi:undecaprenyl-diphosphatase